MTNTKWHQLWVRGPEGVDPVKLMGRCDPLLQRFGAVPKAPEGVPLLEPDGTIEVRVYGGGLTLVKRLLEQEYGFTIEREEQRG